MILTDKTDLPGLPFTPSSWSFRGVQVEWKGWVLNPVAETGRPLVDLSDRELHEILPDLFPNLSFVEVTELLESLESTGLAGIQRPAILNAYGFHPSERLDTLIGALQPLPLVIRQWMIERRSSPADLLPLLGLTDPLPDWIWEVWQRLNPSRSEGKVLFDLLVDLQLFGRLAGLSSTPTSTSEWIEALRGIRYPRQTDLDRDQANSGNWPQYVRVKGQRQGDQMRFEMRLDFLNSKDLNDKLTRLQQHVQSEAQAKSSPQNASSQERRTLEP